MKASVMKDRLLRYWTYFRRGHGTYFVFLISFLNTVILQYYLLIKEIPFLRVFFTHFYIFTISFFVVYIPLATFVGWMDYKKGAVPVGARLGAKSNPWVQDLAKAIILLAEGKRDEVIKLMNKWIKEEG